MATQFREWHSDEITMVTGSGVVRRVLSSADCRLIGQFSRAGMSVRVDGVIGIHDVISAVRIVINRNARQVTSAMDNSGSRYIFRNNKNIPAVRSPNHYLCMLWMSIRISVVRNTGVRHDRQRVAAMGCGACTPTPHKTRPHRQR